MHVKATLSICPTISFPDSPVGKESPCNAEDPGLISGSGILIHWRDRLPTPVFLGFPCGSAGKESACDAGDLGSIPGLGRSSEEGKGYPLQHSGLENSMDCIVHWIAKSRIWLSFTSLHFSFHHCVHKFCSLCLCLYSCPANRFICTIFLDSTYMWWHTKFVILFPTYFT